MTNPYQWLSHPEDPLAPKAMTEDIRDVVIREQLERLTGLTTEQMIEHTLSEKEMTEMLEEVGSDPSFLAVVESESIRRAAQVRDVATHSIEAQAVTASSSGLHGY